MHQTAVLSAVEEVFKDALFERFHRGVTRLNRVKVGAPRLDALHVAVWDVHGQRVRPTKFSFGDAGRL